MNPVSGCCYSQASGLWVPLAAARAGMPGGAAGMSWGLEGQQLLVRTTPYSPSVVLNLATAPLARREDSPLLVKLLHVLETGIWLESTAQRYGVTRQSG
jgi:hypothetical protein